MIKTVSATEAKSHFGALVEAINGGEGDVIVENRGEPSVAIIPISRYANLERLEKEERLKKAGETLRRLRAEFQARNPDMTEDLADELASRASNDVIEAIAKKLKASAKA
jgi:prevent-host-death family protein